MSRAISKSLLLSPAGLTSGLIAKRYSLVEFANSISVRSHSSAAGSTMSLSLAVLVQNGSVVMIASILRIASTARLVSGWRVKVEPLALNITLMCGMTYFLPLRSISLPGSMIASMSLLFGISWYLALASLPCGAMYFSFTAGLKA